MPIFRYSLILLLVLSTACSLKLDQQSADLIFRVTARNLTYELLTYAPDLQAPLKIFLQAFQLALENNQPQAISLLEKEALAYLENRFAHNPLLIQDIKDLYKMIQIDTDFSKYQKYKAVIDGALSGLYIFEAY
jgi:hypothetical protein